MANEADNLIALPDARVRGGGQFFSVDRRAFSAACALGLNPAVAYLTIARGAGFDHLGSFWSVDSIERHTGISRPKAKAAVQTLVDKGLLTKERGGSRPRYLIVPGHEITPPLSSYEERSAYNDVLQGNGKFGSGSALLAAARGLESQGLLKAVGAREFVLARGSAEPELIWLPNVIVEGAADETPPLHLLRQMQDVRRLRLFVSMYDSSDLANDGGISRSVLWQVYALTKVGQRGASTVWGFDPVAENITSGAGSPLAKIYVPNGVTGEIKEAGYKDFWAAIYALRDLKLVEFVPHVFESDQPESEMIHPYAVDAGEPWEVRLSLAAHEAGRKCLSPGQQQWAEEQSRLLLPVRSHIDKLAVIGIARLKYRPQTKMTAAWYAKSKEKAEVFTPIYEEISRDVIAPSDSASAR